MMLHDSHRLAQTFKIFQVLSIGQIGQNTQLLNCLEEVISIPMKALLGGTGGEISCPIRVGVTGVREEIFGFVRPSLVQLMQFVEVAGGR